MMGHREKMRGGDEFDALHRKSRRIVVGLDRPGIVRKAKQKFNRRVRKEAKAKAVRSISD